MIGSRKKAIHINAEEIKELYARTDTLEVTADYSEAILKQKIESRIPLEKVSFLQFELMSSGKSRKSEEKRLDDDIWLFARFKEAAEAMYKATKVMKEYELRDMSQRIHETLKQTISLINKILQENNLNVSKVPDFPDLEKRLNYITQAFLEHIRAEGHCHDQTDDSDKTLLYLVRDVVVMREFKIMLYLFKEDTKKLKVNPHL